MATYDVHQHLWPVAFPRSARRTRCSSAALPRRARDHGGRFPIDLAAHEPEARIRALDRDGSTSPCSRCKRAWVSRRSASARETSSRRSGPRTLQIAATSDGRFLPLASRVRSGFAGMMLGASALLDFDRVGPARCRSRARIPVFVHPEAGAPPPEGQPSGGPIDYPAQMQAAYLSWLGAGRERWPTLRIVFALLAGGAPFQLERLAHRGSTFVRRSIRTRSSTLRRTGAEQSSSSSRLRRAPARLWERHAGRRFAADTGCRPRFRRCCGSRSPNGHTVGVAEMSELAAWLRARVPADTDLDRPTMSALAAELAREEHLWRSSSTTTPEPASTSSCTATRTSTSGSSAGSRVRAPATTTTTGLPAQSACARECCSRTGFGSKRTAGSVSGRPSTQSADGSTSTRRTSTACVTREPDTRRQRPCTSIPPLSGAWATTSQARGVCGVGMTYADELLGDVA